MDRCSVIVKDAGHWLPRRPWLHRAVLEFTAIATLAVLPGLIGIAVAQTAADIGAYAVASLGTIRWNAGTDPVGCVTEVIYGYEINSACTTGWQDRASTGWRLGAGWQFNRWIAAEAVYANLGDASVGREYRYTGVIPSPPPEPPSFTLPSFRAGSGRYRLQGAELTAIASIPIGEQFAVIGRAGGYAYWQSYKEETSGTHSSHSSWTDTMSGFAPVYGAGIAWRATPTLEVRLEWTRYQNVGRLYGGWLADESGIGRFDIDAAWLSAVVAIPP
jgi:hypothetical protein